MSAYCTYKLYLYQAINLLVQLCFGPVFQFKLNLQEILILELRTHVHVARDGHVYMPYLVIGNLWYDILQPAPSHVHFLISLGFPHTRW